MEEVQRELAEKLGVKTELVEEEKPGRPLSDIAEEEEQHQQQTTGSRYNLPTKCHFKSSYTRNCGWLSNEEGGNKSI